MKQRLLQLVMLALVVVYATGCSHSTYGKHTQKPKYRKAGRYW